MCNCTWAKLLTSALLFSQVSWTCTLHSVHRLKWVSFYTQFNLWIPIPFGAILLWPLLFCTILQWDFTWVTIYRLWAYSNGYCFSSDCTFSQPNHGINEWWFTCYYHPIPELSYTVGTALWYILAIIQNYSQGNLLQWAVMQIRLFSYNG
jgi:hypothetical protein